MEALEAARVEMEEWINDRLVRQLRDALGKSFRGVSEKLGPWENREGVLVASCPRCNGSLPLEGRGHNGLRCRNPRCGASWLAYGVGPVGLAWGFSS